jgi:hypothetical protein
MTFVGQDIDMGNRARSRIHGDNLDLRALHDVSVSALVTVHPAVLGIALRLVGDEGLVAGVREAMQGDAGLAILNRYIDAPISAAVAQACFVAAVDAARHAAQPPSRR